MTKQDSLHHRHAQWAPRLIKVRICLSEKSSNTKNKFYSYISEKEGYTLPTPCFFATTSKDSNSFRVQLSSVKKLDPEITEKTSKSSTKKNSISFHVISNMEDISIACSKLNMANALDCKIVAELDNSDVIFTISAPNEATEKSIVKNFNLFDAVRALR